MATLPSDHSCASLSPELTLLRTPEPPYYAVISINIHHGKDMDIYNKQLQKTYEIANTLPGYLGTEAAKEVREDGSVYAVATLFFTSLEAIEQWRRHPDHLAVKKGAKQRWFLEHNIRICQVVKHYGANLTHTLSNLERVKTIKQKVLHDRVAPEQLLDWIDPHATINSPANFKQATGAAALLAVMDYWTQVFPNVTSRWQKTQATTTGQVMVSWEAEAVHDGTAFFGVPAQSKPVTYSGTTTYHFNDQGKLIQYDVDIDLDAIKAQLR